jgi:hypothetical protein
METFLVWEEAGKTEIIKRQVTFFGICCAINFPNSHFWDPFEDFAISQNDCMPTHSYCATEIKSHKVKRGVL